MCLYETTKIVIENSENQEACDSDRYNILRWRVKFF